MNTTSPLSSLVIVAGSFTALSAYLTLAVVWRQDELEMAALFVASVAAVLFWSQTVAVYRQSPGEPPAGTVESTTAS